MNVRTGRLLGFRVLAVAYAVTSYGTYLNMVALALFAYELTGSALNMGLFMVVRLASGVVAGVAFSTLVARVPRKWLMVWSNVAPAAALVLLVLCSQDWRVAVLFATAAISGCGNTLFLTALRSAVPDMVGQDRRTWANSLLVTARSLAMVAGFASAGLAVTFLGYEAAFLVDAASFVLCAAIVAFLPATPPAGSSPAVGARSWRVSRVVSGFGGLVLLMICLRAVDAFGSSSHNVALPVYSAQVDPVHPTVFASQFWSCWAVGNVLVQQGVRCYTKRRGRSVGTLGFAAGTVLMSAAFILGLAGFPLVLAMVFALLAGSADGLTEVSYANHLQTLRGSARDRAFGLSATVENLGFGLGMIINAGLLAQWSPLVVVAGSHGPVMVAGLLVCVYLVRRARLVAEGSG